MTENTYMTTEQKNAYFAKEEAKEKADATNMAAKLTRDVSAYFHGPNAETKENLRAIKADTAYIAWRNGSFTGEVQAALNKEHKGSLEQQGLLPEISLSNGPLNKYGKIDGIALAAKDNSHKLPAHRPDTVSAYQSIEKLTHKPEFAHMIHNPYKH